MDEKAFFLLGDGTTELAVDRLTLDRCIAVAHLVQSESEPILLRGSFTPTPSSGDLRGVGFESRLTSAQFSVDTLGVTTSFESLRYRSCSPLPETANPEEPTADTASGSLQIPSIVLTPTTRDPDQE